MARPMTRPGISIELPGGEVWGALSGGTAKKSSKGLRKKPWQKLRLEVLGRDGFRCCACGRGDDDVELHVHHQFYFEAPADIHPAFLKTYCSGCHQGLGVHPYAGVWWDGNGTTMSFVCAHCPRCGTRKLAVDYESQTPQGFLECLSCREMLVPNSFPGSTEHVCVCLKNIYCFDDSRRWPRHQVAK